MTHSSSGRSRTGSKRLRLAVGSVLMLAVMVGCSSSPSDPVAVNSSSSTAVSTSSESFTTSSTSGAQAAEPPSPAETTTASPTAESVPPSAPAATTTTEPVTSDENAEPLPTDPKLPDPDNPFPNAPDPNDPDGPSTSFTGNSDNVPLTAPGTQLRYGDSATVPITFADADGVFTFGNLTVTKGSANDWTQLGVDPVDSEGQEPWYLRATVKQESGGDFTFASVETDLFGYTADDVSVVPVFVLDYQNPLCPVTGADDNFGVGDSYSSCTVLPVESGVNLDRIQFEGSSDLDSPYFDKPVVWKG